MPALKRTEAEARAQVVRAVSYDIRLDLTSDDLKFGSVSTVRFEAEAGATTFLDLAPVRVASAVLNGRDVTAGYSEGRLQLSGLQESNELVVDTVMAYSHDGEGLVRYVDPADGLVYLYAMSFLDAAPRWFACFDQPDLKAPLTLTVSCPDDWTVAGNGPPSRTAAGEWTVRQDRPLATYMATLVAGPYHSVRGEHDGIPLVLHGRASLAPELDRDAPALLAHTAQCFDELHRLFGLRYPWGEYHQAFVPNFNAGAMENPGCVTFRDQYLFRSRATHGQLVSRNNTIAHEMAHMWFGDLVTMRWWDDLWLNESFAEYLGHGVCATLGEASAWIEFAVNRKSWGYPADRRPSTHPVAGNGAADSASALDDFDGISYAKGASVLRQLAARLGDDVFLGGLRDYIASHAFGNAEFADLLAAWTAAGAEGLSEWADQWLRTADVDTLRVDGAVLRRESPPDRPAQREHAITVRSYPSGQTAPILVRADETALPLSGGSLLLPGAGDETWAKIGLADAEWNAMPARFSELDPLARAIVWNALQLAVNDAEVNPELALRILCTAMATETDDILLSHMVQSATDRLLGIYLPDAAAASERLAAACEQGLAESEADSGRQLATLRGLIAFSTDPERLERLRAGEVPDGVVLDPDLRWRLTARLCALGSLGPSDIEAELAADTSAEGAERAALCSALVPTEQAKQDAWRLVMTDADRPAVLLYATARGFWDPLQTQATEPYAQRYFAEIAETARLRSGWVVGRLAALTYPSTAVTESTLTSASRLLDRPDLHSGLRRAVVDATDDLRRAVISRSRFA
jgi:aminopeptidase N